MKGVKEESKSWFRQRLVYANQLIHQFRKMSEAAMNITNLYKLRPQIYLIRIRVKLPNVTKGK